MKYLFTILFLTFILTVYSQSCTHTIRRTDTFGDGWNGGTVAVSVNGVVVLSNLSCTGAGPTNSTFTASAGSTIRVYRTAAGTYPTEMRIQVLNNIGTSIINTIQPVTGTATTGGQTVLGSCSVAPSAPANDLVCNAISILCGSLTSGTTVNATTSGTYESITTCGTSQTMPAVWYKIVGNGQIMSASLCGTVWDSKISVFSGSNCTSLSCLGGIDDDGPSCFGTSASYQWTSVIGTTYWIKVHGYSTNTTFNLSLTCTTPPTPGPCINSTAYGTQVMPVLGGAPFETVSCQYAGEYSTWSNAISSTPYIATSTSPTDWITVRSGTYNGTIIAYGNQPLSFTPAITGTIYIHTNSDSYCASQSICRDISVSRESALPVELLYFEGKQLDNINLLEWSTASEYNSDYFIVEVSKDGESWKSISQVDASINSNQKIDYSTIHAFTDYTHNYYRLIQYDFDGQNKTYGPIGIDNRRKTKQILKYINTIGQEVPSNTSGIIFVVYEDGSTEKIYQ
jgi:hypothetical protein